MTERHGHQSGRFDVDPDRFALFLVFVIHRERLSLLTTTESRNPAILKALRLRLPQGFRAVRRGEYLIIWHAPTYRSSRLAWLAVLDPRNWPMLGGHRMFRVARVRLTHRPTGTLLRVDVAHAPSGVAAGPGRWNTSEQPRRVRISQAGFAREGRSILRYRDRHPHAALALHMDSNLDQMRAAWRLLLEHQLGALSVWSVAGLPHDGTHGARLIDTAHTLGLTITAAAVYTGRRPAQLDHRPFTYAASYTAGRHRG